MVTHGTDTMEETAYLVDLTHDDPRPVVFTGAQQAADSESPDGPGNLARAIAVAGSQECRGKGVLLAFAGTIFPAAGVRKCHTTRLDAFANPDFGTAGSVSDIRRGQMQPARPDLRRCRCRARSRIAARGPRCRLPRRGRHPPAEPPFKPVRQGSCFRGPGTGNANRQLCREVADAIASGVVVVTSTRVEAGAVVPVYGDGGGEDLRAAGAIASGLLRPSQSLILLSLLLRLGTPAGRGSPKSSPSGAAP